MSFVEERNSANMTRAADILKLCEEETDFVKPREKTLDLFQDFATSQESKRSGSRNKATNKWASRRFHKSAAGKRLHRKLDRFNATDIRDSSGSLNQKKEN